MKPVMDSLEMNTVQTKVIYVLRQSLSEIKMDEKTNTFLKVSSSRKLRYTINIR